MLINGFEVEEVVKASSEEVKREVLLKIYNLLKDSDKLE